MSQKNTFISHHSLDVIVEGIHHLVDYSPSFGLISHYPYNQVTTKEMPNGHVQFHIARRRNFWNLASISGELIPLARNRTQVTATTQMYGRGFWLVIIGGIIMAIMIAILYEQYLNQFLTFAFIIVIVRIWDTFFEHQFLLNQFGEVVE